MSQTSDIVDLNTVQTLAALFGARVQLSPEAVAYRRYEASAGEWVALTWEDVARQASYWQSALSAEKLVQGDRVAIMAANSPDLGGFRCCSPRSWAGGCAFVCQ